MKKKCLEHGWKMLGKVGKIWEMVEQTMAAHQNVKQPSLKEILEADLWAREYASSVLS